MSRTLAFAIAALATTAPALAAPGPDYALTASVALGSPDRWDYVVDDPETQRVYVAHGDRLAVIDARTGKLVGQVEGITGGTHGTAISVATHQGFTDDGRNGKAVSDNARGHARNTGRRGCRRDCVRTGFRSRVRD